MINRGTIKQKPFDDIDTIELLNKIRHFRSLDRRSMTFKEIDRLLSDILSQSAARTTLLKAGQELFRVRRIAGYPDKLFTNESDVKCAKPSQITKLGRINQIGEPMLYVTQQARIAVFEMKIQPDEIYALIRYKVKQNCSIELGFISYDDFINEYNKDFFEWTERGKVNCGIINDFLVTEFTRDVHEGSEYYYNSSISIAKRCYDMYNCQGYVYPSVANKTGWCIALKPEVVDEKLDFAGIFYCKYNFETNMHHIEPIRSYKIESGKIIY